MLNQSKRSPLTPLRNFIIVYLWSLVVVLSLLGLPDEKYFHTKNKMITRPCPSYRGWFDMVKNLGSNRNILIYFTIASFLAWFSLLSPIIFVCSTYVGASIPYLYVVLWNLEFTAYII